MKTPIQIDRTGTSPADTQKDGCCGGHGRHEAKSHPKDGGCCGGGGHGEH